MIRKLLSIILTCAMLINLTAIMPINAFAASGSSRTYEKDGYSVTYIVGSEWDNSQTIYITLKNTGKEPILNWALKYDNLGSVSDIWNAYVAESTDEYIIVKNNGYNFEIPSGKSVNFGYTLSYEEKAEPEDIEIFSKRIEVRSGHETEFNVTDDWYTGFQGEISVSNTSDEPIEAWTLSFDGNFDIDNIWNAKLLSNENRNYKTAAELWTNPINPGEKVSFGFTASKSATDNIIADNFKLTAVTVGKSSLENDPEKEDPDEDIDYELDSDNDGLPDYYEDILGTDKNNADTDGDGIPDGYEVFYLGTDPTKADSDDNGTNDGDEDFDNDGLSNKKEYELGTDPNNADTDGDGLSDGAEVNTHGTDPLKYDTDDDGISDGDELKLGLDPKNGSTDGTPDSEKTFTQTVSADSEVLSEINNDEETPFKVSLEITAAGVAENNVYARESGYSNAIENSAIIGTAPEFVYTDGLSVEEVTVKFELESSVVSNTLGTYAENNDGFKGIKRLMVFMFFEDVNMLLPVETEYDEANNTVSATTDRVGTYCLMDMELFFKNLGIEPDDSKTSEISEQTLDKAQIMPYNGNELVNQGMYSNDEDETNSNDDDSKDHFDVVFLIDEISYTDTQLNEIKKEIQAVSEIIFKHSKDVTISIYGLDGSGLTHSTWYGRADNITNVGIMLSHVSHKEIANRYNQVALSECIDYVIAAHKISSESAKRPEYGFVYYDPYYLNSDSELVFRFLADSPRTDEYGMKMLELVKSEGTDIDFSTVTASYAEIIGNTSYANNLSEVTNGTFINGTSYTSVVNESIEHIYGKALEEVNVYKLLIATDFEYVNLEKPITEKYIENAIKYGHDYISDTSELDEEDFIDCADTDGDGLWDFQEIKVFKGLTETPENQIIWFEDGKLMLPTVNDMTKEVYKDIYSSEEIDAFREYFAEQYGHNIDSEFWNTPVLPINSHPIKPDTDGDEIPDSLDGKPAIADDYPQLFKELIISRFVEYSDISYINFNTMICTVSLDELYSCIDITNLDWYNKFGDPESIEIDAEPIDAYYILASGMGDESTYFAVKWNDISIVKQIKVINQVNTAKRYTNADFSKLKSEYPEYALSVEIAENAQLWLESVSEVDNDYISDINKFIDNSVTNLQILYKVTKSELVNAVDNTYRNAAKGFFAAAYHTTDTVTKLPTTVLMIPKSYIESDYLYRCDFEEKYGYRPFKYSGISRSLFTIETAFNMGLYVLDDFENQAFLGTDADREQYLGGMLFELCVTLITTETAEALDKASASAKVKNADDYIDIINKPDAELSTEQLAYKKACEQSKQIDDIAAAVKKNSGATGKENIGSSSVIYDPKTGHSYISYKEFAEPPITQPVKNIFDDYHNLSKVTSKETGAYGEKIAKRMLEDDNWTILYDVKNASNNGIDIVAQNEKGYIGFFEVKASSTGKMPSLSSDYGTTKGQQNMQGFVKQRIEIAMKGEYNNEKAQKVATQLYDNLYRNGNDYEYTITASTVTVDFSTDTISVAKW